MGKGFSTSKWIVDGSINVTDICEAANWHLATVHDRLIAAGLNREDAEAFAAFVFEDMAVVKAGRPEDLVTDEQYERLDVG